VLVTSSDRAAALNVAKQARSSGLEAGLMRSEPYDLGSGLWIVFSGQFTTPEGAERQAAQLAERYPGAYPQRIQRSQ
jgi:SPOR domain